jgi:S-adenosylmethionine:tRNA ribosyltransferase-isomerase
MIGNARRWKSGSLVRDFSSSGKTGQLTAVLIERNGALGKVLFSWTGGFSFSEVLESTGKVPLPPYIRRDTVSSDQEDYQTIYSEHEGSVAAPTAGLHFSTSLLDQLKSAGIKTTTVTLHVGAGTFRPITSETAGGHDMHRESFSISKESLTVLAQHEGPVIPVGTTSVRTLESLYYLGNTGKTGNVRQWDVYKQEDYVSRSVAMDRLAKSIEENLFGSTSLMIVPGYKFRMTDAMITNFHQPGSTLLMLVAAFYGEKWKELYNHALREDYRFLSYGDGMLLLP